MCNVTLAVLAVVLLFLFAMPLPHHVFCSLEIKPRDAKSVYVEVPGQLKEVIVRPGQAVHQGAVIARLTNLDIELAVADLEGQLQRYQAKEKGLRHARSDDEEAAAQLPGVREMVKMLEDQLVQRRSDLARLDLVAPVDGVVLPPPETNDRAEANGELRGWTGSPFAVKNLGATLSQSMLFCEIGDPHKMEADLIIEQDDLEYVHKDQPVTIKVDELPHRTFQSTILEIEKVNLKILPKSLSSKAGGEMATKTDEASGTEKPFNTSYQALAPLDDPEGVLTNGLKGRAKISTNWQTLGSQRGAICRGRSTSGCSKLRPAGLVISSQASPAR